eukprot:scaffold344574_cov19-Prasinocladus_malaysianus.AAC.1
MKRVLTGVVTLAGKRPKVWQTSLYNDRKATVLFFNQVGHNTLKSAKHLTDVAGCSAELVLLGLDDAPVAGAVNGMSIAVTLKRGCQPKGST